MTPMTSSEAGNSDAGKRNAGDSLTSRAAATLPDMAGLQFNNDDQDPMDRIVGFGLGIPVFVLTPLGCFIWVATLPWGWALILAGVVVWMLCKAGFRTMRGSESGSFSVDDRGIIRVHAGRLSVRKLEKLFDVGAERWMRHAWVGGTILGLVICILPATVAVLLDAPWIMVIWLTTASVAMWDFLLILYRLWRGRKRAGGRMLDGKAVLPALAIYSRHHGWRAAVSGVPADRLATTLAEHPDEVEIAQSYADKAEFMTRLAGIGGAAGGISGLAGLG